MLSIFAIAVFLLGANEGFSQAPPAYSNACPTNAMVMLPAGGGTITFTDANIPALLGTTAFDPDGVSPITYSASPSTVDCSNVGMMVTITVTAADVDGSTDCDVTVTVVDGGPTAVCQDITVDVGSLAVTVMPADIDGGSSGCTAPTLTIMGGNPTYDCTDIASSPYTLTLDAGGGVTCTAMVTVVDNVDPIITCAPDMTFNTDAGLCTASGITNGFSTIEVCGTASVTNDAPAVFPLGTTTVTSTITDNSGNTNTCTQDITVVDNENPTATCQNISVNLSAAGSYTLTAAEINNGSTDNCSVASVTIPATTFTCADLGANSVVLTVTDGSGNTDMCTATVTVVDNTPPSLYPNLGPINNATNQCEATVTWPSTLNDACSGPVVPTNLVGTDFKGANVPILIAGPNFFGDFPIGVSTVTYDVSDGTNTTSGSFTITVVDTEDPTILCPTAQTQEITSCAPMQMVPSFIGLATISDNCPIDGLNITQSPAPNTDLTMVAGVSNPPADGDTYDVMISVTDGFNTVMCGPFTVTLSEDDAPDPDVPGATLPILTSTCGSLIVTAPTATDACGNPVCGDPFPVDPTIWNQVPGTGPCPGATSSNSGASTNTPVTIPDLGCVTSDIIITGPGIIGTDATLDFVTLDISHSWDTDLDITLIAPDGTTTLNLSSDNGGTGDDYTNTIFQDGFPNITTGNPPFTGMFQAEGGSFATAFAGLPIAGTWTLEVCDDEFILDGTLNFWDINFSSMPTGSVPQYEFEPGNHVITWIYDDGNGNSSSQLQQINVSNDVVDPVVTCQDITLELDGNGDASLVADDLQAPDGFTLEMQEDVSNAGNAGNVSLSVTVTSATTFSFDWDYETVDPGFEALTYFVNGSPLPNGNIISATTTTGNTTIPLNAGDVFTISLLTIDNTPSIGLGFPPFPPGDISTAIITNFSPGFTGDYSIGNWDLVENGVFSDLSMIDGDPSDDCTDVMTLVNNLSVSQNNFDCSDIGTPVTVTLSTTDDAGNIGSCTAMVTVVDALAPTLMVTAGSVNDTIVECDAIPAVDEVVMANDNCDGALTVTPGETSTQSNNSASCAFYNYDITRTWTATDANSNTGTITQVITVEDNTPPAVDGSMVTRNFTTNGNISTDAIGCTASVSVSIMNALSDCAAVSDLTITNNSPYANAGGGDASGNYPIGSHNIQFTITDPCGNVGTWGENFTVFDGVAPVASCVNNLNLGLPASGILNLTATAVDNNSFDACGGVSLSVSPSIFDCSHVGIPQDVTLTVSDGNGNSSTCTTTVNIQDNNAPTAICTSTTVYLDANGNASISASSVDGGSFDDCTAVTTSVSPSSFTAADLGNNTVTLTVTDGNGNSTGCSANVTVMLPPTCFTVGGPMGGVSGGAGEVVSLPVTADDFTALVGFQFELEFLNDSTAGEFVGISGVDPDLSNVIQENLIVTDSFISQIDSMIVMGSMGQDSTVYDSIYTDNIDRMSISWNQFNTTGGGSLVPVTFADGDILFYLDILLTGNIGDFTFVGIDPDPSNQSTTTPPQVVYSFGSGFVPAVACVTPGVVQIGELIVSGDIYTEDGAGINLVDVILTQPPSTNNVDSVQTGSDGAYDFTITNTSTYKVTPSKNINWSNGIDILDVSLIQRHSVGNPYVNSAYKKIAADVSGDGLITTFDAVLLNAYLASLFMNPPPPTPSWQFADAKQPLANNQDAFVPAFNSMITLTNISSDSIGNDFIGLKTGDLGGLVNADTLQITGDDPDDRTTGLEFMLEDRMLKTGEQISLDFNANNFEQLVAYQWLLEFDNEVLSYQGYDNVNLANLGDLGFGEVIIDEGKLVMTWYNGQEITKTLDDVLFTLNFEVKADARLSDLLKVISHDRMIAKAYNAGETPMDIELIFTAPETKPSSFALNQNTPNPFKDETLISFTLPENTDATLTIMDITGRVLKSYEGNFVQGYNEISINRGDLPQAGTLIYELRTPQHTASKKMILID